MNILADICGSIVTGYLIHKCIEKTVEGLQKKTKLSGFKEFKALWPAR